MSFELTPMQRAAVENRGGALLVSAAAGSGKTKVLVQRLMDRVLNENNDITDFLIITYTRAAAAELRSRILDELTALIAIQPQNRRLQRQLGLAQLADITTVHAFCAKLLRENAHLLDIAPDFRMADEQEAELMKAKVLDQIMEEQYENPPEGFFALVDALGSGRDDSALCGVVLDAYAKVRSHPYPSSWMNEKREAYDIADMTDASQTRWGAILIEYAAGIADYWVGEYSRALDMMDDSLLKAYGPCFTAEQSSLIAFKRALCTGWDVAANAVNIPFGRLSPVRNYEDKALQRRLQEKRNGCKEAVKKLNEIFSLTSPEIFEDITAVSPIVSSLFKLVERLSAAYQKEKQRKGMLDFSDLEHMTISILRDGDNSSALAALISERYAELMVDEYQDTNEIHDLIISSISRAGKNVFMVGDVKQSIYRFRLADPTIFLNKYKSFKSFADAGEGEPRKVVLSQNFRSRHEILDAVNFVFKSIMSPDFGEMIYADDEYLYAGAQFPEIETDKVELDVVAGIKGTPLAEIEARFVAKRIRQLLDEGILITDSETKQLRPLSPGDIVILMRSPSSKRNLYARALASEGVSCSAESGESFFETIEISILNALLAVIDNPAQDIPLISVLRSPLYGFTADELAEIRLKAPSMDFYTALKVSAEDEKCALFIKELDYLRFISTDMAVDELIWRIFHSSGMLGIFGAMKNGETRKANLMKYFELARKFEGAGYKGLFSFTAQIRKMIEQGKTPDLGSPSEGTGDSVRIMSIHKSKGLEFPVVILSALGKSFNREDLKKAVLMHTELGVGPKRLDMERLLQYPTLPKQAVEMVLEREMLSEELRVLYVAMTRAREKLIMTCALSNPASTVKKLESGASLPVDPRLLADASSVAEWILYAALTIPEAEALRELGEGGIEITNEAHWNIRLISLDEENKRSEYIISETVKTAIQADTEDIAELERRLNWRYPYLPSVAAPSKITATQLKGRFGDLESAENTHTQKSVSFARPSFVSEQKGLTAAEKGTALHLVMQHIALNKCVDIEMIEEELLRLCDMELVTESQAEAVNPKMILSFIRSPLGRKITEAKSLMREFKFSLLTKAEDYYPGTEGDEVLLQGVVDCCVEEPDGLTVIDFKTDNVYGADVFERAEIYRGQLEAYSKALCRITGKNVKSGYLYFFTPAVEIKLF